MKVSAHLTKGVWALADKSLPMLYGAALVLIVVRALPTEEFGAFYLFQSIFLIVCILGDNFLLQPMVKLAAESHEEHPAVVSASILSYGAFLAVASLALWAPGPAWWGRALNAPPLALLMPWMAAMLFANMIRNIVIRVLQIHYRLMGIFWTDAVYYGVIVGLILFWYAKGTLVSGREMIALNLGGAVASSIVGLTLSRRDFWLSRADMPTFVRVLRLGIYQAGTGALQVVQQQADSLIIGGFWGSVEVTTYAIAKTFFRAYEAVRDAAALFIVPATSRLSTPEHRAALGTLLEKLLFILFIGLVPASLVLAGAADPIFHFCYGASKDASIPVFRILAVIGMSFPLTIVGANVLLGLGRTRELFRVTALNTALYLAVSFALVAAMGAMGAAIALFVASFAYGWHTVAVVRGFAPIHLRGIASRREELRNFMRERLRMLRAD